MNFGVEFDISPTPISELYNQKHYEKEIKGIGTWTYLPRLKKVF